VYADFTVLLQLRGNSSSGPLSGLCPSTQLGDFHPARPCLGPLLVNFWIQLSELPSQYNPGFAYRHKIDTVSIFFQLQKSIITSRGFKGEG